MSIATVAAIATAASVLFIALQAMYARQQRIQTDVDLLTQLSRRWDELRADWQLTVMLGRGVGDYYVDVSGAEVAAYYRYRRRLRRYGRLEDAAHKVSGVQVWWLAHRLTSRRTHPQTRQYEFRVRRVLVFLATVAGLVADGSLRPSLAYAVFGSDLVRAAGALRSLIDRGRRLHGTGDDNSWVLWLDYYPGVEARLLALLDVLWAEAVRQRDVTPQEAEGTAAVKAVYGTGKLCRARLTRLSLESRRTAYPLRLLTVARLRRLLVWAEIPPGVGVQRRLARVAMAGMGRFPYLRTRGALRVRLDRDGRTVRVTNRGRSDAVVTAFVVIEPSRVPKYPLSDGVSYALLAAGIGQYGMTTALPSRSTVSLQAYPDEFIDPLDHLRLANAKSRVALVELNSSAVIRSASRRRPRQGWTDV